jgi:alpha-galactosidase
VAGWTSWYAYFDKVTEQDIHRTAEVMAETLLPFGYTYLQIDDGYQRLPIGLPGNWLNANEKFPSGLADLRRVISAR